MKINISGSVILLLFAIQQIAGQNPGPGIFSMNIDIGAVRHPGSVEYNPDDQTYSVSGSGTNMWGASDELHFAYKQIKGDFILRARVAFIGNGTDPHRKIGWTIRENLESNSAHVSAAVHGDGLTSLQFRKNGSDETEEVRSLSKAPDIIQLERKGDRYILSTAQYGEPFVTVETEGTGLATDPYVGLFVCSHNPDVTEQALFSNVRIIHPAPDDFVPYRDYIGSNLEIMDVESGIRRIIHREKHSIQAPNWTQDGTRLIYNSEGLLYNFDLNSGQPSVLNTGFANNNNNDHVLSFEGSQIAISHHNQDDNGLSTIYTLPVTGSDHPQKITADGAGASYLHGWSPDDKNLVFTANRKDKYDIYKIDLQHKVETQLTDTKGLDDGPEYSPDGKYIYFNSNRTGTMQIWRMHADGSNQEQMTFDRYNDWFPHISPDGKWMVILSFMDDIDSADHPFYKHVYLRLMPAEGGEPGVIAYIYGGQGTINVPSWSPDGKSIAFVSNSIIMQ